ncbi:MAG: agmatinase [Candidatus Woesearchaeota archaeon]
MADSIINSDISNAKIVLLGANYDKTSSFGKGADKGVNAIKSVLDTQIEFYDRYTKTTPSEKLNIGFKDINNLNKLTPEKMVEKIKQEYLKLLNDNKFVILIGGEHSVSNGPIQAINEKFQSKQITIVQFDAHFDLRNDDSDYNDKPHGCYAHSTIMRRTHELGFRLVQVGIRAYSKDELDYAIQNKDTITFFEWGNSEELFNQPSIKEIISSIKTKDVYISIDVDGFDPSVMPDTGTPVPGGISWDYGVKLLNKIFKEKNVIGVDVVEVAPKDKNSVAAYNAAQLIHNIIGQYSIKKI